MSQEAQGTTLSFVTSAALVFSMVSIKPPSLDGGDKIPATNLSNEKMKTYVFGKLKDLEDAGFTADIDPATLAAKNAAINVNQQINIDIPITDASKLRISAWGRLRKFDVGSGTTGERWTGEGTLDWSNQDNDGVEQEPTWTIV